MKKNIHIIVLVCLLLSSCKSYYIAKLKVNFKDKINNELIKDAINLNDFNVYVFELCEIPSFEIEDNLSENIAFPLYSNCNGSSSEVVIEKTYLLLPKSDDNKTVIYITTISLPHNYEEHTRKCINLIFNCKAFKTRMFIEDVNIIYLGHLDNNQISFYKNTKNEQFISKWNFEKTNDDSIIIKDVTLSESAFTTKPQIKINSVFSIPEINLNKKPIEFRYGKNHSYFQRRCTKPNECGLSRIRGKNIGGFVDKLYITEKSFYFVSVPALEQSGGELSPNPNGEKEYYRFSVDRMHYYYKEFSDKK